MPRLDSLPQETAWALRLAAAILLTLTGAKAVAQVPYLGPAALTAAAFVQLYLPLWRCDVHGLPASAVGLPGPWRRDVGAVALLAACCLPLYGGAVHILLTAARPWLEAHGLEVWAQWMPQARFAPRWPQTLAAWLAALPGLAQLIATHVIGVALPEETFYRGYLQPQLERRWPPHRRVLGVPMGGATVACTALFAAGHFLGEWQPARLAPFFPGLLFAWLRNRHGSVAVAVAFHGLCNVASALWLQAYRM